MGTLHLLDKAATMDLALRREIDALTKELHDTREGRRGDTSLMSQQVELARQEAADTVQAARVQAQDSVAEAGRRANQEAEERRRVEQQYNRATQEVLELNQLIKAAQDEATFKAKSYSQERDAHEEDKRSFKVEIAQAEDRINALRREVEGERDAGAQLAKELRKELLYRGERFVEVIKAFQLATGALRQEASELREQLKTLSSEHVLLKNLCARMREAASMPRHIEAELSSTISRLFAKIQTARDKLDDAVDECSRETRLKEEQKSRVLLLEESLSRAEHELSINRQSSNMEVSKHKIKTEDLSGALSSEREVRAELEARLQRAQANLDAATANARELQQQNASMSEELDNAGLRHTSSRQELDSKTIELAAHLKRALQERDTETAAKVAQANRNMQLEADLGDKSLAIEAARQELASRAREVDELRNRADKAHSTQGSNQQMILQQLKQTQEMLKTIQGQKSDLATQNQKLREEVRAFQTSMAASLSHRGH